MENLATKSLKEKLQEDDLLFKQEISKRAKNDFTFFFNNIFVLSIEIVDGEEFKGGAWVNRFCKRLQFKKRTCTTAPRKHAKTTILLGFLAWLIFRADVTATMYQDYFYLMYSDSLAGEKIQLLKQYINANEYFSEVKDLKPTADTICFYKNNGHYIHIRPAGILSFKRGKHPHGVICDDILKDAEKKLDLTQIQKITQIFESQVTPLAKEGGFLHVGGTRQDDTDIFGILALLPGWDCEFNKAIVDRKKKIVLWPEKFTFERLIDIELNETGKKNFRREYQDEPVRGVEGYFTRAEIENQIDKTLRNYGIAKKDGDPEFGYEVVGAHDIGKKRHPAHLTVFALVPVEENGIERIFKIQLASIWMDHVDYNVQIEIDRQAIRRFGMTSLWYDNTRGEFEGFAERGELPDEMIPFVFTRDNKFQGATDFDKEVGLGSIIFVEDERQTRSICSVDGNLEAPETEDGHGDAFWSTVMMLFAANQGGKSIL